MKPSLAESVGSAYESSPGPPSQVIDHKELSVMTIEEMVRYDKPSVVDDNNLVEVMEDKEPREEEPAKIERGRNPGVHVVIIPWRRIVRDHRWAFCIVVVVNHPGFSVLWICRRWGFAILARGFHRDRQTRIESCFLKRFYSFLPRHR
jgi:hypothetical protein